MKRIYKNSSKKGFTLLEVMLAVAIMAIASTMIMQGFMAIMNIANNSSVYAKIGAKNYETLAIKLATASNTKIDDRYSVLSGGKVGGKISITGIKDLDLSNTPIYYWHETGSTGSVTDKNGNTAKVNVVKNTTGEAADQYVDNRTAFFYMPQADTCTKCKKLGYYRLCNYTDDAGNTYKNVWVCTYKDPKTGEYCLNGLANYSPEA